MPRGVGPALGRSDLTPTRGVSRVVQGHAPRVPAAVRSALREGLDGVCAAPLCRPRPGGGLAGPLSPSRGDHEPSDGRGARWGGALHLPRPTARHRARDHAARRAPLAPPFPPARLPAGVDPSPSLGVLGQPGQRPCRTARPPALRADARATPAPAEARRAVDIPPPRACSHALSPGRGRSRAAHTSCSTGHAPEATESSRIGSGPPEGCPRALRIARRRLLGCPMTAGRTGRVCPDTHWTPPIPEVHPHRTSCPSGLPPV